MKKMTIIKGFSKYIIIVIIGVLLALFVARIQYDTQDLSASVLSLTEQDFFESTKWDAGYKKENQIFEIFLSEQARNGGVLTISILSSPEIERFIDQLETPYYIENIQENYGNIILNINGYENGDLTQGILQIPYSGDSKDITLEYVNSENLNFAIGCLDNIIPENQTH